MQEQAWCNRDSRTRAQAMEARPREMGFVSIYNVSLNNADRGKMTAAGF